MNTIKSIAIFLIFTLFSSVSISDVKAESDISAYIIHKGSNQVIQEINADTKRDCARLSLLPSLLIISEAIESGEFDIKGNVTVSMAASKVKGSTAFIETGEVISAENLYKSAAMICAGDAIYALSEAVAPGADKFVELINSRLCELNIESAYKDILGTDILLSASDISKIAIALSDCKCFLKYSQIYMDSIVHSNGKSTELVNQNRLIRNLQGCTGLCTGSSKNSGYCGAFYTERNGCEYIGVVLGAKSSAERFEYAQNSLESAYNSYKEIKIVTKGDTVLYDYPIMSATKKGCDVIASQTLSVLTENNADKPKCVYDVPEQLTAPINAGDCIGNARYLNSDGNVIGTVELTVSNDIKKAGFFDFFRIVAEAWIEK